ncbi:MAG TPA: tRNA (adenosine(37)-N6)-dimethylallyltransferase MiaA [Candidatus Angelobacter sp.]|nr:tRNA (adenosine(37)-N6)-dimethylallyltransferase MiaA [Candidatus Angelobacter sp.]
MRPPAARFPELIRLLAIIGPTATGKTPLAVAVAGHLAPAELLNADSRQVIRGLQVATCAPTAHDLRGIPAHLFALHDPGEPFSVAAWLDAARSALSALHTRQAQPILVGGTGLYVAALLDGLDLARVPADPERRAQRSAQAATPEGLQRLAAELAARDPDAAVDVRNLRRVVRALEILDARGAPLHQARGRTAPIPATRIGLDAPRDLHDALIAARARAMFETGALLEEVHSAMGRGVTRGALESAGIGYREALAVIDGQATSEQAIALVAQRTRRYAKAQRTWFRRDGRIRWLQRGEGPVEPLVDEVLDAFREDARVGQ